MLLLKKILIQILFDLISCQILTTNSLSSNIRSNLTTLNSSLIINSNNHFHQHQSKHNRSKKNKLTNKKTRTVSNLIANLKSDSISSDVSSLKPEYVTTTIGKEVQLDCKIKELVNDDDRIVWLKMPKGEVLTLNSNRVSQDTRLSTKCATNITPCWSLIITDTRESDTGFYVCQTNSMQTKYVYLDIMVPPKLLTQYPVDKIDVNQSSNFSITCEFYGKPEPLVKWFKYQYGNAKEMEKFRGLKTINLHIHKDSPNEYECVADNSIPPTISKKIFLNIQYSPQVRFLNSRVFQKKNEKVILDCKVNSNPKSKIVWYKNTTRLFESDKYSLENLDDSYYRLYINDLTEDDFSDYICTAVNLLGKSSAKAELIELKTISLNDIFKTTTLKQTTQETSTSTIQIDTDKTTTTNETVIQISSNNINNDDNLLLSDFYDNNSKTTTLRTRIGRPPSYRSNKLNHTKNYKHNRKQYFYHSVYVSTTKYSFMENKSFKTRSNEYNLIFLIYFFINSILKWS